MAAHQPSSNTAWYFSGSLWLLSTGIGFQRAGLLGELGADFPRLQAPMGATCCRHAALTGTDLQPRGL